YMRSPPEAAPSSAWARYGPPASSRVAIATAGKRLIVDLLRLAWQRPAERWQMRHPALRFPAAAAMSGTAPPLRAQVLDARGYSQRKQDDNEKPDEPH